MRADRRVAIAATGTLPPPDPAPPLASIDASRRRVRTQRGWNLVEMLTGHDAMISAPQPLAELLHGLTT